MKVHDSIRLFNHLFYGLSGQLCIALLDRETERMRQKFFDYPESVNDASQFARTAARSGKDAYFCVHLLTDARRKKECAGQVHALWADGDGATIPEDFPAPTAVVESSPGRHHYYWQIGRAHV